MTTPRISLVAYEDRNPVFVFVAVPNERGRYVRTDTCVLFVTCPQCGASVGEPCHNSSRERRYWNTTHHVRRAAADRRKHTGLRSKPRARIVDGELVLVAEGL